jgi:hypothetical protein
MPAASESVRAGRTFYVPEVRVAKLGPLRSGPEAGDPLEDLLGDVLRVEVTRVASGLSQYAITLNNTFHSLPRERGAETPTGPAPRESKLLFPRYKYNHFDLLAFGQRLRIDLRYWPDPVQRLDDPQGAAKGWVPMIAGPITDMKFTFAAGEGARLEITGTDDLHSLTNKTKKKEQFNGRGELEIVRALFDRARYPVPIAAAQVERPKFMSGGLGISEAVEARQSYFDLIKKIAEKYDLEAFVEFAPTHDGEAPSLEFHLEPSRSRLPPDKTLRGIFVLDREKHLVDFTPTLKLGEQFTSASIKGRHRIRTRADSIEAEAVGSILADELHRDDTDPPLTSAPEVRLALFPGEENPFHDDDNPNLDEERARVRAEAILRRKAREFLTISATTIGLPLLRPGRHVEIRGFRPPFDGFYYVFQTVHSFGDDGLRTRLTARRPGMPLPSTYQDR